MYYRRDRSLAIDGLRGVAAIAAAAYGLSNPANEQQGSVGMFAHGYLAADVFFCLSGFVLARAYGGRIATGVIPFREFARRRLIRLLPLMAAVALAVFLARMMILSAGRPFGGDSAIRLLADVPFGVLTLPHYVGVDRLADPFPLNPVGWFVFVELLLNLAWAAGLAKARIEIVIAAAALAFAVVVPAVVGADSLNFATAPARWAWLPLVRGMLSFLLGVATWRLPLGKVDMTLKFELLAIVLWCVLWLPIPPSGIFDLVCVTLLFPYLILFAAEAEPIATGKKVLTFLGAIAFPLFAIHMPLRMAVEMVAPSRPALVLPLELGIAIAFAWGIHTYFEVPLYERWVGATRTARERRKS